MLPNVVAQRIGMRRVSLAVVATAAAAAVALSLSACGSGKPPQTSSEDFTVSAYAAPGLLSGDCTNINQIYRIGSGWKIDRSKGDAGHPGVRETKVDDNQQSRDTLRGYNYLAEGDDTVRVQGRICGASAEGPGAIFKRTYTVYTAQR